MINLVIADDHVVLRQALCELLGARGNYNIMAQAADGEELLNVLKNHKPDLVIMDLTMPKLDGVKALEQLQGNNTVPVLVLSANEGSNSIKAAMKAGAKGYLPKNVGIDELEFAINSLLKGQTYLSPGITSSLMKEGSADTGVGSLGALTKREIEILTHLADGKPNREIGKILHISTRTVDTHRSNILKKLKLKTNAELVKLAITNGLISV